MLLVTCLLFKKFMIKHMHTYTHGAQSPFDIAQSLGNYTKPSKSKEDQNQITHYTINNYF